MMSDRQRPRSRPMDGSMPTAQHGEGTAVAEGLRRDFLRDEAKLWPQRDRSNPKDASNHGVGHGEPAAAVLKGAQGGVVRRAAGAEVEDAAPDGARRARRSRPRRADGNDLPRARNFSGW